MTNNDLRTTIDKILDDFFTIGGEKYIHELRDAILEAVAEFIEKERIPHKHTYSNGYNQALNDLITSLGIEKKK